MRAARRALTLVELTIGLGFAGLVSGVVFRLLLANQRVARVQTEHAALQDNVRAGIQIVASELRGLGFDSVPAASGLGLGAAASGDILIAEPGRIRYRGMRGLGFTCGVPAASLVLLRAGAYQGPRQPVAGVDSISLFVEGDPGRAEDDAWVRARVTGVSAGTCADGAPALALSIAWESPASSTAVAAMVAGGPAWVFEIMELQYYRSEGRSWLGMRSVSRGEVIQPLIGPLADSTATRRGFTLGYLDRGDAPTAIPSEVRTVTIALLGVTAQALPRAGGGPGVVDSLALTGRVTLRNMLRP